MKLWVCTDHRGFWPVGVASIVVAPTEERARVVLADALTKHGLATVPGDDFSLREIDVTAENVVILADGDY